LGIEVDQMTKLKNIFDKYTNGGSASFTVDTEGNYYFALTMFRAYAKRFEIIEEMKLVINFSENIDMELAAVSNTESKNVGLSLNHQIWALYKIDKEKVQVFAEHSMFNVKIYFTTDKNIETALEDDNGMYWEFGIESETKQSNLIEPANCFLQIIE
jgi:hypothetical protein